MTVGSLVVKIGANITELQTGLAKASKSIENVGRKMTDMGKTMSMRVTAPVVAGFGFAVKAASDAEETVSKFATVFRDVGDEAEKSFGILRNQYGLSSTAAKQLLGDTGDLLTGFGFTQTEALGLSEEVNKLAVDLASFTNFSGGAEGASKALTKALLGERESVKSLGISILEEDVKKQMAINSSKGMTFATERQAKAQATLDLAIQQSQNAIGDYARTSDSFANQTRLLQARLSDLAVEFGTILLPSATKMLNKVQELVSWFSALGTASKEQVIFLGSVAAATGPVIFGIGKITLAVKSLTAAMIKNPFTAIAVGLTTIGVLAFSSHKRMKSLREETERLLDLDISELAINELDAQILDVANTIDKLDKASFSLFGYDFEKKKMEGLQLELSELIKKRNELVNSKASININTGDISRAKRLMQDFIFLTQDFNLDNLSVAFKGLNERISENQNLIDAVINNSENITEAQADEVRELIENNKQLEHEIYLRRLLLGLEKPTENTEHVNLSEQERMVGIQDMLAGKMQLVNDKYHKFPSAAREVIAGIGQVGAMSQFAHNIAMNFTSSFGQGMANVVVQGEKLVDVLKNIGKLLLSSAIQFGLQALLTGGLGSGAGFFGKGGGLFGKLKEIFVDDALITSGGDVVKFHPNDSLLAMKDFSKLNTGGSQRVEVYGTIKGQDLFISSQRGSTSFNR